MKDGEIWLNTRKSNSPVKLLFADIKVNQQIDWNIGRGYVWAKQLQIINTCTAQMLGPKLCSILREDYYNKQILLSTLGKDQTEHIQDRPAAVHDDWISSCCDCYTLYL